MREVNLLYDGPVADVYIDGRPSHDALQTAFCEAFAVTRPAVFDGNDGTVSFVDFLERQTVAETWHVVRDSFPVKLNIYLHERTDVSSPLLRLAAALGMSTVIDLGESVGDDRAILFTPEGSIEVGLFQTKAGLVAGTADDVEFVPALMS